MCGTTRRGIENGEENSAISEEIIREIREQTIRAKGRGPVRAEGGRTLVAKGDRPIHAEGWILSSETQADTRSLRLDHAH
jgi:hypothetical protein